MASSVISEFSRIPTSRQSEFWNVPKIQHLRRLAETGSAVRLWTPVEELTRRPLDRVRFTGVGYDGKGGDLSGYAYSNANSAVDLAYGRISLTSPLYLGDMSYGALSGVANIAIARAADVTGVIAGTGEGGLHPDVAKCKRITVQWASARFGVDLKVLNTGMAIVLKIGQGAKPGMGGHLPGTKVTEPISLTRRIPVGRDAISPAPHHDIYSIEDLGQRIWALKEATGKPVFVKIGVTNYVSYIASGVARMGGDGIILDASGAGTGAAPSVVKDNVGLPIEIAVAAVDRALRIENLREGFSVIAAGRVSNAEDAAKLMALGADCASIGTACLICMGCLMVHKCHMGFCPTLLTNKTERDPKRLLSPEKATEWMVNLIRGWTEEFRLILDRLDLKTSKDLVGRKDLLQGFNLNEETAEILGVKAGKPSGSPTPLLDAESAFWTDELKQRLQEMAGTAGRAPREAVISSMGSVGPPFVDAPTRIADWIVSDGAQVTRPSIDPYREEIETACYLARGKIRLSTPVILGPFREEMPPKLIRALVRTASSMGTILYLEGRPPRELEKYARRIFVPGGIDDPAGGYVITGDDWKERVHLQAGKRPLYLRLECSESSPTSAVDAALLDLDGVILDEDRDCAGRLELEVATSEVDAALRKVLREGLPLRTNFDVIAMGERVRLSSDVFKLCALGADAVGISTAATLAVGYEKEEDASSLDEEQIKDRLENLILATGREIKLLAGAAGVSSLFTTLVGNRELLRAVDMEPAVRRRLRIKPAGLG